MDNQALVNLIKRYPDVDFAREATITIEVEPEQEEISGYYASGEDELDRQLEAELIERSNSGDTWAWCCVRVHASIGGVEASSSWLGACSYEDEKNFRESGGYFDDMKQEALAALEAIVKGSVVVGGTGEVFELSDSQALASLVYKRFGKDAAAASAAWRRLLQNSTTESEFQQLVTGAL